MAVVAALAVAGGLLVAAPAQARPWPGRPDRNLISHVVRPGDTATGLSVRYHAWTQEFIRFNGTRLRVGERVTIPVVISAARRHHAQYPHHSVKPRAKKSKKSHKAANPRPAKKSKSKTKRKSRAGAHGTPLRGARWRHADMSRTQVRDLIARHARYRGVPVRLAQAVAWQESGWRQPLVSSAGAIGVMQVLPTTGQWMSALAGQRLYIRDTHGNVRAGTMLLRLLLANTRTERSAVAAYYEGLGGIQNGWYDETKQYVRSVMAIKRQLERTGRPTG